MQPNADVRSKERFLLEFKLFEAAESSPFTLSQFLAQTDLSALKRLEHPFLQFDAQTLRTPTPDEAFAYCRQLARSHYENFAVDGPILPRRLRTPFCVVYAYCRWSDDLGDELGGDFNDDKKTDAARSLAALDRWESNLRTAFERARSSDGAPQNRQNSQTTRFIHPIFVALTEIFRQFPRLPLEPFANLLTAFRLDQTRRAWNSLAELEEYCRFSANPVGRIVLGLFLDAPTPRQLELSDAICTGLQLANFWQDVVRDAKIGRVYLPADVRERNGGNFSAALRELVAATREKFEFGRSLPATLPFRLRVAISLFLAAGVAVLDAIERDGFRTNVRRPTISKRRKFAILVRSTISATFGALFSTVFSARFFHFFSQFFYAQSASSPSSFSFLDEKANADAMKRQDSSCAPLAVDFSKKNVIINEERTNSRSILDNFNETNDARRQRR